MTGARTGQRNVGVGEGGTVPASTRNGDRGAPIREAITISPPNLRVIKIPIRGTAAYVQNRFSAKVLEAMREKQAAGSVANKGRKRSPKDFEALYTQAQYRTKNGKYGIPASAFRNAMIDACRMVGYKMTHAKMSVFVVADDVDATDGTSLTLITKGRPHRVDSGARNDDGSMDIRARPMWDAGWEAVVSVQYDADQFTASDVVNLIARAGVHIGVGEGRPYSRKSAGQGWGTFEVIPQEE